MSHEENERWVAHVAELAKTKNAALAAKTSDAHTKITEVLCTLRLLDDHLTGLDAAADALGVLDLAIDVLEAQRQKIEDVDRELHEAAK